MTDSHSTLPARWWVALLALFVFLAPVQSFAAKPHAKTKAVAAKAKHGAKAKRVNDYYGTRPYWDMP